LLRHQPCSGGSISADLPLIADFFRLFVRFIRLFPSVGELSSYVRSINNLESRDLAESGPVSVFPLKFPVKQGKSDPLPGCLPEGYRWRA
jgi:hypothetical protein